MIFPQLPALPFEPYRASLYTAEELYGTGRYTASADARIYAWSAAAKAKASVADHLASALHDHAIDDALDDLPAAADPRRLVGVMGGHGVVRGDPGYRAAADLGNVLTTTGRIVTTGGGPGAMEAANLGAYLSPWPGAAAEAIALLARAPGYSPAIDDWLTAAREVRMRWPAQEAGASLSIPTWFYGHEPSNLFARWIAKFFTNALREDTLLHRCRGGIVFLPGAAGTVQEIFQAATENYYAADGSLLAPMVLVGVDYWTHTLPAWPLLRALAGIPELAATVCCVDTVAEAAEAIADTAG